MRAIIPQKKGAPENTQASDSTLYCVLYTKKEPCNLKSHQPAEGEKAHSDRNCKIEFMILQKE